MTIKNPEIPVEANPKRIRVCEIPEDGICFRYPDGHEEYIRACPKCGHRLEVSKASGRMPKWVCPLARFDKRCSWPGEPMASMSLALASEIADVFLPEACPRCNGQDFVVEIHRRKQRVEVVLRHRPGHPCSAQVHYIFHTFSSDDMIAETWDDEPDKFRKLLRSLPQIAAEEAARIPPLPDEETEKPDEGKT